MSILVKPRTSYHASWLESALEFEGTARDGAGGEDWALSDLSDAAVFETFVRELVADALPEAPRKAGYVPCSYFWIVEGNEVLGSLAIRHELNDFLLNVGGHIGYSVRPSARRQGHATHALKSSLPIARDIGLSKVLVTCDEDNHASRATIEKSGGVYEDGRRGKLRYWIETS